MNALGSPSRARICLVVFAAATRSRGWKRWELVMAMRASPRMSHVAGRNDVKRPIVIARILRQEHPQTVADGDSRGHDQERIREAVVLRTGALC